MAYTHNDTAKDQRQVKYILVTVHAAPLITGATIYPGDNYMSGRSCWLFLIAEAKGYYDSM